MTFCYFDTIAGISGDMTLGALVSAGLGFDALVGELKKLNLTGYELEAKHVERNGITATKIDVVITERLEALLAVLRGEDVVAVARELGGEDFPQVLPGVSLPGRRLLGGVFHSVT